MTRSANAEGDRRFLEDPAQFTPPAEQTDHPAMVEAGPASYKQMLVLRTDLNMRRGKEIAQGAHASIKVVIENFEHPDVLAWLAGPFAKIAVGIDGEEALLALVARAREAGILTATITDAGRTEFHGRPTLTAAAIGPATAARLAPITGHLKLR